MRKTHITKTDNFKNIGEALDRIFSQTIKRSPEGPVMEEPRMGLNKQETDFRVGCYLVISFPGGGAPPKFEAKRRKPLLGINQLGFHLTFSIPKGFFDRPFPSLEFKVIPGDTPAPEVNVKHTTDSRFLDRVLNVEGEDVPEDLEC
jgi:hypothetical protein